ncbi:MAG: leucine-rich repeat domain-containing protein [Promethearchaeota archaeon]
MKLDPDYIILNLKEFGKKEGLYLLKEYINNSNDPIIRKRALENLGKIDYGKNFAFLEHLFLSDEDPYIRLLAGNILKESYSTNKKLIRVLEYTLTKGENILLKLFSFEVLSSIDSSKTRKIIIDYLKYFISTNFKDKPKKYPHKISELTGATRIPEDIIDVGINLILDDFYTKKLGYLSTLKNGRIFALICESANLNNISDIIGFENLTNLEHITIQRNKIRSIAGIENLKKLKSLNLSHNRIEKIENLDNIIELEELDLSNNKIQIIENLQSLTKLKKLLLNDNSIKFIENLQLLKSLEILDLSHNLISEIKNLDNLVNLKRLNLSSNKIEHIKGLNNLTNLMWLYLNDNHISQIEGLASLRNLRGLYLSNNSIEGISSLENQTNLRKLELSNNKINRLEGLNTLGELQELYLDNNSISEVEGLEGLNKLIMLHLGRNRISKFRNISIESLKNLNFIFLNENPLNQKSFLEYQKRIKFP